jgi:outer membrane protein assembly factor BamB
MMSRDSHIVRTFLLAAALLAGCQDGGGSGDGSSDALDAREERAPCEGITCSGHGQCVFTDGVEVCQCESGYHAAGWGCIEDCVGEGCAEWPMLAANPLRTSWTQEEVRGDLGVEWYRPFEPYIPYKVQPIAAGGIIYVSTARGLYAVGAESGDLLWVYPTQLPLGHSPTIAEVGGRSVAFVGGYDRRIHAVDAMSGLPVEGYTPHEAGAGFGTNPLVVDGVIYAGSRDGYFYALDAATGALRWRYRTGGAIMFSAAMKDGVVYFASSDACAYALDASDGTLVWKSETLTGAGFQSFWPVVYTEKTSGLDYVILTSGENYRQTEMGLTSSDEGSTGETEIFFSDIPTGELIGPTGMDTGAGTYWGHDAVTMDVSVITDYYEDRPHRRTVHILERDTGLEYSFDSDGDGRAEYAPFSWSGVTQAGCKFPPVINGIDGVYYQDTAFYSAGWVSRGGTVGWQFGTDIVARVSEFGHVDQGDGHASDEPRVFSSGGRIMYMILCCDRMGAGFDVTIPYGQEGPPGEGKYWRYYEYSLASNTIAPGYQQMYDDGIEDLYNNMDGWQIFSGPNRSRNGVYGKHGNTQSPPIPYRGRLYFLKGNALLAFGPAGGEPAALPLAETVPAPETPATPARDDVAAKLETEVQKMLDAGHLRPGYHAAGFIDLYGIGHYTDDQEYGEIFDYFQNPSDTVVTLIGALPYLPAAMQEEVKTYLQTNYGPGAPYDFTEIVHVGFGSGAQREAFITPPDAYVDLNPTRGIGAPYTSPLDPATKPTCGGDPANGYACGYWFYYPPFGFYAAWKYAEVFGGAQALFDGMREKFEPFPDSGDPRYEFLSKRPYLVHLYIAGYRGYLELQRLAGYPEDADVRSGYESLLDLRIDGFDKDTPWYDDTSVFSFSYQRALSVARNFMFLTPELGDAMNGRILGQVQEAVDEYDTVAPYWLVSQFDNDVGEGTYQHLYDCPAMFQARAFVLKEPYGRLAPYLDAPAFVRGDLFFIQNLVAALSAAD